MSIVICALSMSSVYICLIHIDRKLIRDSCPQFHLVAPVTDSNCGMEESTWRLKDFRYFLGTGTTALLCGPSVFTVLDQTS